MEKHMNTDPQCGADMKLDGLGEACAESTREMIQGCVAALSQEPVVHKVVHADGTANVFVAAIWEPVDEVRRMRIRAHIGSYLRRTVEAALDPRLEWSAFFMLMQFDAACACLAVVSNEGQVDLYDVGVLRAHYALTSGYASQSRVDEMRSVCDLLREELCRRRPLNRFGPCGIILGVDGR